MREVLFKNLTSPKSRKKDIILKEIFEKDGISARTERRCFYFIKEVKRIEGELDMQGWLESNSGPNAANNRHFYIMKEHNDKFGEDKVVCKIAGTFYAVINKSIYTIAFLHAFKVQFVKTAVTN